MGILPEFARQVAIQPIGGGGEDKQRRGEFTTPGARPVIRDDEQRNQHNPQHRQDIGRVPNHLLLFLFVERVVNFLRQFLADTRHPGQVFNPGARHLPQPPKFLSRRWRRWSPIPGICSSTDSRRALPRRSRWPVMAKRCASSRICWIRCSAAESAGSIVGRREPDKKSCSFRATLAPLGHTHERHAFDLQFFQYAAHRAHLTLPPSISSRSGSLLSPCFRRR